MDEPPAVMALDALIGAAADVVRQADEEQDQHQSDPHRRYAFVDLAPDRPPAEPLDERERDVTAVQRQQREQVQNRERQRDEGEDPQVEPDASLVDHLARGVDYPDRARDL